MGASPSSSLETIGCRPCTGFTGPKGKSRPCILSFLVNSYGEDDELTTSSDSDEEVFKQFQISVSRSQSFRSMVSEKATQAGSEGKQKFSRLLSNHEELSTEASECEGIAETPQHFYLESAAF